MTKPAFDQQKNIDDILNMDVEEAQQNPESSGDSEGVRTQGSGFNFDIKPEELEEYLNQYVVNQEATIEVIATKVCTHFNRMKLEGAIKEEDRIVGNIKSNMLLIGPTGVGKTFIVKLIAKKIGVPFVKADATKFSETGYVGGDVEDLVRELVHEAEGDVSKAEYGIIYLDEIDKIASSGAMYGPDVSRTGVQRNLLKLMEEADVDLKTPHDLASQVEAAMEAQRTGKVTRRKISTRNILFIVSGAFNGLDEIINKRLNRQSIGFNKDRVGTKGKQDLLKLVRTEDLIEYGFESEFVGRLPVYVVLNELDEDGLFKILTNKHSTVVLGKKMDFKSYGIELTFTDDALRILSSRAHQEKTGARGLLSVFEKTLIKFEKTLPSTKITSLDVTGELVQDPEKILHRMLINDSIGQFQKEFLIEHGVYLEFNEEAVRLIDERTGNNPRAARDLCEKLFHDYFHGLRLMKLEHLTITRGAVEDPEGFINGYIKEHYHSN
ncbi:MAG TPA: AAA family ATPase [Spirochaetota bacterium]|nr:AAA family ATPase [Spirochaetota bacterium]HPI88995.1 AAA family ATPase [Spirochaetota bacterium]HPR47482.1 AAA family ATPase [Spirochaetota bacterium]